MKVPNSRFAFLMSPAAGCPRALETISTVRVPDATQGHRGGVKCLTTLRLYHGEALCVLLPKSQRRRE